MSGSSVYTLSKSTAKDHRPQQSHKQQVLVTGLSSETSSILFTVQHLAHHNGVHRKSRHWCHETYALHQSETW